MEGEKGKLYYHPAARPVKVRRPPMSESSAAIGAMLRERRYDKGYTQAQVTDRLRTKRSQGWLSRIENGRFARLPRTDELRDLCRLLGTNRAEILEAGEFITEREMSEYLEMREATPRKRGAK